MTLSVASDRERGSLSDLVARVDLFELVERHAGQGRKSGSRVTYSCPNPAHADHHPSFVVSTTRAGRQMWRCFSQCAAQGDALDFVEWLEGCSTAEAARRLRSFVGDPESVPRKVSTLVRQEVRTLRALEDSTPRPDHDRSEWLLSKYLEARGWPLEVVERFSLEVVVDQSGALRIRHPYFVPTRSGEWVVAYWQDRGTKDSKVKWLSPKGAAPVLYNLRSLARDSLSAVVVCEGPADTITASVALGDSSSVAVVGVPGVSAWRSEWARLFDGLRVVVAADNDSAGEHLEASVRSAVNRSCGIVRCSAKDLTDTALEHGLGSVRELLLRAVGAQAAEVPLDKNERLVRMILEAFPGSEVVKP